MSDYADWYGALRDVGYSEEAAAALVDRAVCEDALARRLGRPPTAKEVEAEYERMVA